LRNRGRNAVARTPFNVSVVAIYKALVKEPELRVATRDGAAESVAIYLDI
jgi:hypothetical protein